MLEAALERDTNRMVTTAVRGVDIVLLPTLANSEQTKARKRVMRLLAGVVQYAKYLSVPVAMLLRAVLSRSTHEDSGIAHAGHDGSHRARWRLIVSIGGSLAAVGGARFGDGKTVYNGPFSLSLGLGLQNVPATIPVGLHLELGCTRSRAVLVLSIEAQKIRVPAAAHVKSSCASPRFKT